MTSRTHVWLHRNNTTTKHSMRKNAFARSVQCFLTGFRFVFNFFLHMSNILPEILILLTKENDLKRYKWAMISKKRNQRETPTPKTEVGKT